MRKNPFHGVAHMKKTKRNHPIPFTLFLAILVFAGSTAPAAEVTFPVGHLVIVTARGKQDFDVEVAKTQEQQEYGLMFRSSMPQNHGMVFDFGKPHAIEMWMKNTLIPLDMVFANDKNIITHIVKNAKPESTERISSGGEVKMVIELNGGATDRYAIREGDRVMSDIFK